MAASSAGDESLCVRAARGAEMSTTAGGQRSAPPSTLRRASRTAAPARDRRAGHQRARDVRSRRRCSDAKSGRGWASRPNECRFRRHYMRDPGLYALKHPRRGAPEALRRSSDASAPLGGATKTRPRDLPAIHSSAAAEGAGRRRGQRARGDQERWGGGVAATMVAGGVGAGTARCRLPART